MTTFRVEFEIRSTLFELSTNALGFKFGDGKRGLEMVLVVYCPVG